MSPNDSFAQARGSFADWRARYPRNLFSSDVHLAIANEQYLDGQRLASVAALAEPVGAVVGSELGAIVEGYRTHLPELVKFDGHGNPFESIRFDAAYHMAGRLVWGSGMLELAGTAGKSLEMVNLFYLFSHEGEMGHMCAATCTTGLVRVIRRHAHSSMQGEFLPALTSSDYDSALRGAQFLTEVQGGSDVGANVTEATLAGDGTYRITGEKWFCSVADADLFLLLARPSGAEPGTRGLGCFVVPRTIDGRPNGFSIRRLKDKLGTTDMASAEVDFDDAKAQLVAEEDDGFKIMVTAMLNTSRLLNAVGDVGIMRRAYLETVNYAAVRTAFEARIGDFPLVKRQLAEMKAEWLAALHSTWELAALDESVDIAAMGGAAATGDDAGFHRYLVNANKLGCSLAATGVARQGIEILGGNGAIEEFSVLPRLLRDAVVYEQWEGTHNVLTAQVLRDMGRLGLAGIVIDRTATILKGITDETRGAIAERALASVEGLVGHVTRSLEDAEYGALHFRAILERLLRSHQVALLLNAAEGTGEGAATELAAAARLLVGRYLDADYVAEDDRGLADMVAAIIGPDLD